MQEAFDGATALLQRARSAGEKAYTGADYDLAMGCFLLAHVLETSGGAEQSLQLLDEAQKRFETIAQERASKAAEGMASACLTIRGDCLRDLGRLDDAAEAYEEAIRRDGKRDADRDVAVGKAQLGTVRLQQHRYTEALTAYQEARVRFTRLGEPGSVASAWHRTGIAYQGSGQAEMAEDAYRQSLAINVRLGDIAGQASALGQLGLLYDDALNRTEEAVAFLRLALDKYAEIGDVAGEGRQRNNLAIRLRKLGRLNEARQEIHLSIECNAQFGHVSEPWKSWAILANIETEDGKLSAAAEAKAKAIAAYLAYRRDGGENHNGAGRLAFDVTQSLLTDNPPAANERLQAPAADPNYAQWPSFIPALQAIVAGNRDPKLANAPDLHYTMAAEILLLLETLAKA